MVHRVTVIPGDGIGPDVIDAACRVFEATGVGVQWDRHEVGLAAIEKGGDPLPETTLTSVRANRVALKGPVSTPTGRSGFRSVNVGLRRSLGLFAQVRPCRSRPGVVAPFLDVDVVVIRETTEDLYAGIEFESASEGAREVISAARRHGRGDIPAAAGLSIKFVTQEASRRLLEFAIEYARREGRMRVTVVHKANVMRCTDGILLDVAREIAPTAPDIEFDEQQIDNVCGQLVRRPEDFDILVMGVQYGDVVSDLAAGLVGGVGVVPGVNVGGQTAMFEPAHGTAPRLAGLGRADPTAAILCGALLLAHLGEPEAAQRVEQAVEAVVAEGRCVTYDLRSAPDPRPVVNTEAMTDAIVASLARG
ncbi:MAG TPA: isocitrate/isopropylmalate family dehydrogenase [Acidimicrobiia bacterium]